MGCGPSLGSEPDLRGHQGKKRSSCVMNCIRCSTSYHRCDAAISIRSAILIQNWYRRYRARLEARRRCTWTIFQTIEYAGEQDQLKLYNFFNDMLMHMNDSSGKTIATVISNRNHTTHFESLDEEELQLMKQTDPYQIRVENSYKGAHLTFPLDTAQLDRLFDAFRQKRRLHAKYVIELLYETRKVLKTKANINQASTAISNQITVCGDLHGKVGDVFMIFYKNGLPSTQNPYVFNGDFVDRGGYSVETAMVLFACFLVNPNCVYLNRGNHEDHVLNLRYGFIKEIMSKYKEHAPKLIRLFEDVFSWLPLATVIDQTVLVTHGGISDKTDLTILEKIDRHKYISVLRPPINDDIVTNTDDDSVGAAVTRRETLMEWRQILDILWSDPKARSGCRPNTFRGGGSYFGPDISRLVLKRHGLKLLIRSHECKQEGFEFTHDGLVLTIFSASNYYEEGSNKGAYVKLGVDMVPHIIQYMVPKNKVSRKLTITQRVTRAEESAIRNLRERICSNRSILSTEFEKYDPNKTGLMKVGDWCKAMEDILQFNLPWRTLRPQLAKMDINNMVLFNSTFEQFQIRNKFSECGQTVTEALYKNRDSLEVIFRAIDADGSGKISMNEFSDACALLSDHTGVPIPQESIVDLARSIDINKDGFIDFNEFLEAFRMVDSGIRHDSIDSISNCSDRIDSPETVT